MEPKQTEIMLKAISEEPKGAQSDRNRPKGNQQSAEGRPKCIYKYTFGQCHDQNKTPEGTQNYLLDQFETIFHEIVTPKAMLRSTSKKYMKTHRTSTQTVSKLMTKST